MYRLLGGFIAAVALTAGPAFAQGDKTEPSRPRITLRAQPNVGIAPAVVYLTVELIGGADDYEDYYCPTIEWDWGDDTTSESSSDCDPYVPGASQIRRRFTIERRFEYEGTYQVYVRLKQREREVGSANTNVSLQAGGLR
jgi:hypothetical protein